MMNRSEALVMLVGMYLKARASEASHWKAMVLQRRRACQVLDLAHRKGVLPKFHIAHEKQLNWSVRVDRHLC